MRIIDAFLAELDQESKTTRRFLDALPADQLSYQPHEKSMTAGKLALHVATIPGHLVDWIQEDEFTMSTHRPAEQAPTKDEILAAFEKSLAHCRETLAKLNDARALSTWSFKMDGKTLMSIPRVAFVRGWMFNHLYHHRGQLGVYLRLMGARVPASYGPSADENPMEQILEAAGQR